MSISQEHYKVVYIGAGPSTIFSVLEHQPKNALIIEKGKSITIRDKKEVVFGWAGAGCFSDSKLISFGRITQIRPDIDFNTYADRILHWYNYFGGNDLKWMEPDSYEIPSDKLKLIKSRVCHVGTDRSQGIFANMEKYIQEKVCPIKFEEEVMNVVKTSLGQFEITTTKGIYLADKVALATGNRDHLLVKILESFNLPKKSETIQIGVRMELPDLYFKDLMDKFYDFKISMNTFLGRWRTFCVNGKHACVAVEKDGKYVSANGHSYADREPNHLINFGILGQLNISLPIEKQIELAKNVGGGTNKLLAQNVGDFIDCQSSTELMGPTTVSEEDYQLGNLWEVLPKPICIELLEFLSELEKHWEFDGHFFAPEVNIVHPTIQLNEKMELVPNLHIIGDVGYTRSICDAGVSGILLGECI